MFERGGSGSDRVSDLDRQRAAAWIEKLANEGYIRDGAERDQRLRKVDRSRDWRELNAALDGLAEQGRRKGGDLRAAEADRKDAIRRLRVHGDMGHLEEGEMEARIELVTNSRTPNEIAKVFDDLPALDKTSDKAEPRISTRDKDDALQKLRQAHAEGRIEDGEYEDAMSQVMSARTPSELDAAFRCLPNPTRQEAAARVAMDTATRTTRVALEGGRRARKAFLRLLFAGAALLIGVVLLVAGIGIGALLCFVFAVLLFVTAGIALVSRA